MAGMQAAQAFNAAQSQLDLAEVLSQARLASSAGVAESLSTLERLKALTDAHKEMFQRFVAVAAQQLSSTLAELPQDRQEELKAGIVESINRNLAAQGEFYAGRERWVVAASELCGL
ncbi:MAG: hypothetical protein ACXWP6_17925, partial [Ktedonobacterales bacterium]